MSTPGVPAWVADLEHLHALNEPALATDTAGRVVFGNAAAAWRHGTIGEEGWATISSLLVPEEDEGVLGEILAQALQGISWEGRIDVRHVDGSVQPAEVVCTPMRRGEEIVGTLWVSDYAVGEAEQVREIRRLGDRLRRLAGVAADLGTADTIDAVTKIVINQAADAVGATVASLSLKLDDETLVLAGLRGGLSGAAHRWATFSIDSPTPAAEVVRTGRLLVLRGSDAISARYPDLERPSEGPRSMVGLPLTVLGRTIGVISLSFPGLRELDAAELEFFAILADSCAQAIVRIDSQRDAAEQAARMRFLADSAAELSNSLDYGRTLSRVAKLAVPEFADWCAIDLVEDGRLHRLAVEHVDPAKVELALEMQRRWPPEPESSTWQVIRTGQGTLVPVITDEMLAAGITDPEQLEMARALELRSYLVVPLEARGRVLGAMTWVISDEDRHYNRSDALFAEELARRCALAIDNSQLYSQTFETAVQLQHAVLPNLSDAIEGWTVATHYSPAGRTGVGGDFFDAIHLPDGRLVVFVGDVMGRGVAAAASMAQMRAAIRAFVVVEPDPAAVGSKLDELMETYDMQQLVTLVLVVVDPARDELHAVSAGHPPPVVIRADGSAEHLEVTTGAPLGVVREPRHSSVHRFGRGDTLLAFTDGLVERRDEDIDVGQQRVLNAAPRLAKTPLQPELDALVESLRDHGHEDDVAALAVRRTD
ncbi:MAG: SpoIIE family protein phosphatase [Marmoricola sp.]|nr:SpoIIE family protein phosphatase [Marmoricola sp.]